MLMHPDLLKKIMDDKRKRAEKKYKKIEELDLVKKSVILRTIVKVAKEIESIDMTA